MSLFDALADLPHLMSPVALARADTEGKFLVPPHIDLINRELMDVAFGKNERLMINLPFQHGKLLADSTIVWTTRGRVRHGDLVVGDRLLNHNSDIVEVEAISEPGMADHLVMTTDGETIKCHALHEWPVWDPKQERTINVETRFLGRNHTLVAPWHARLRRDMGISLVSRTEVPERGRCIQVKGGIYCVGESFIPTHNSLLSSHYFPAWMLLLFPATRIILAAHEERYATQYGAKVKDVIEKWGKPLGVRLKEDSQAKGEWVVDKHGGGMVCRGMKGALQGRPADLFLIDDPLKDPEQALSSVILENQWDWYQTVAFSRLGPKAPIVIITTRWVKNDLCGKILSESRDSGEKWKVIKIPALAKEGDVLGRKPGEALWEERVPRVRLEMIRKKRGRWFSACWQQEPEDAEGMWFKPKWPDGSWRWPLFTDVGDAYSLPLEGGRRKLVVKPEIMIVTTVDWAWSKKSTADHTAIGTFGLTPSGEGLVFEQINKRLRPEELAPALADVCRRHRPHLVAVETGHPTLANEYRRHPEIPEIRWLTTESKNKLARALHAIMMCENGRIYVPDDDPPWLYDYASQMAAFTGNDDDEDDQVDDTSYFCKLAQELRVVKRRDEQGPEVLDFGKDVYGVREFYA